MKDEKLLRLSIMAHEIALQTGAQVPAERPEYLHLPMRRKAGVPVFDGALMREDQIDDMIDVLERMTRVKRAKSTREQVEEYVHHFGKFGLRKKDIAEALSMDEKSVRNAMDGLVAEGKVHFREEKTRGAGSRRKRYYWTDSPIASTSSVQHLHTPETREAKLSIPGDDGTFSGRRGVGIVHHGTWAYSVACPCRRCRLAFDNWVEAEAATEERMAGGTGYFAAVPARSLRRVIETAQMRELLNAA